VVGQFNFQIAQLNITNQNQYDTFPLDLYIIAVYDGTIVISGNSAPITIGVASREDVLNTMNSMMSYNDIQSLYGGGDFFSSLKNIAKKGVDFLRDTKLLSKGLGVAATIPHPYVAVPAKIGESVASILGFGEGEGLMAGKRHKKKHRRGGVLVGGEGMTRQQMQKRLGN